MGMEKMRDHISAECTTGDVTQMSAAIRLIVEKAQETAYSDIENTNAQVDAIIDAVARWSGCIFSQGESDRYKARCANIQLLCADARAVARTSDSGTLQAWGKEPPLPLDTIPGLLQTANIQHKVAYAMLLNTNEDTYYYVGRIPARALPIADFLSAQ
jgi:hypothetical protein